MQGRFAPLRGFPLASVVAARRGGGPVARRTKRWWSTRRPGRRRRRRQLLAVHCSPPALLNSGLGVCQGKAVSVARSRGGFSRFSLLTPAVEKRLQILLFHPPACSPTERHALQLTGTQPAPHRVLVHLQAFGHLVDRQHLFHTGALLIGHTIAHQTPSDHAKPSTDVT